MDSRQDLLLRRFNAIHRARNSLIEFVKLLHEDPADPDDPDKTTYVIKQYHELIAKTLERVEKGELTRVIVAMPPRHGKTELITKTFVPWYMGRNPNKSVIVATYSDQFAGDLGRDIRSNILHPAFAQVFDKMSLRADSKASNRMMNTQGGSFFAVGRNSAITGRGGDCFPAGTLITTDKGVLPVEVLISSPDRYKVLAYEHDTQRLTYKKIEAVRRREVVGLRRITTARGRVVEATGCHRFFTGRGYIQADALSPGDSLLCLLPETDGQDSLRLPEGREAGPQGPVLRQGMLGAAPCGKKRFVLQKLWHTHAGKAAQFVLSCMSPGSTQRGATERATHSLLPGLQQGIHDEPGAVQRKKVSWTHTLLLRGLRQYRALAAHVCRGQSKIQEWGLACTEAATFGQSLSDYAALDIGAGQLPVSGVRGGSTPARSPHRQLASEQPCIQSGDAVRQAPSALALAQRLDRGDFISSVERIREGDTVEVFDLQIEETHNFFANEILVHNCLIIDDPIKNSQEAQSKTIRESLWTWFTQVFLTRLMSDKGSVLLVQTRWHEDDIVGRLLDPHNPHYDPREAAKWHVLELPAIAGKKDPLKRKPGEALWPERFGLDYLEEQKAKDPRGFNALYQGQPSAETGSFFNERDLLVYGSIKDLPSDLRYYVASDHAVGLKQENDLTCCIPIGIDSEGTAWIHPDVFWDKADTATVVARMIRMIKQFKPLFWWAESGAISKAIGPFLRKQMVEEQAICTLIEVPAITDKMQRAQSIHGRISLGRVRFPAFALWWPDAKRQILQFPYGAHDDFVDTLSLLGMGLQQQIRASAPRKIESDIPKTGSLAWVKWASDQERKRQKNKATTAGW